ncbi:hypothetical protein, partial [Pseudomonas shirazensis]
IKLMLDEARRQELEFDYEGIIDSFQLYVDHGDLHSLLNARSLCTAAAPRFASAFESTIKSFSAFNSEGWHKSSVDNALETLVEASDTYLIILSIAFHTQTKLTPATALNDNVVLPKITKAIRFIEERLEFVLLPGGRVQKSLMASLILTGRHERFLSYYPYCTGYIGDAGIIKMAAAANEQERDDRGYWQGFKATDDIPAYSYSALADALIDILNRFKKLLEIREGFNPDDSAVVSDSDPREITQHKEVPVLNAQDKNA